MNRWISPLDTNKFYLFISEGSVLYLLLDSGDFIPWSTFSSGPKLKEILRESNKYFEL